MFKATTLLLLAVWIGALASPVWAGDSAVKSFRLSVNIPEIVMMSASSQEPMLTSQSKGKIKQLVQEQRSIRGNTPVVVRSIVSL